MAISQAVQPVDINTQIVVETVKHEGDKKAVKASISGTIDATIASLTFIEYVKGGKWHRTITSKQLDRNSDARLAFAQALDGAIKIHNQAKNNSPLNLNLPQPVNIDNAAIKVKKHGKEAVASSDLFKGKIYVKEDKKGVIDISMKKHKLEKSSGDVATSAISAAQQKCIAKLSEKKDK